MASFPCVRRYVRLLNRRDEIARVDFRPLETFALIDRAYYQRAGEAVVQGAVSHVEYDHDVTDAEDQDT